MATFSQCLCSSLSSRPPPSTAKSITHHHAYSFHLIASKISLPHHRSSPASLKPQSLPSAVIACSSSNAQITSDTNFSLEKGFPPFPTVLDINQIRDILPHRYPFLLIDRVIQCTPNVSAIAIKNVTINDGFFQGHFPSRPIMPGVLIVEAMAQVGGVVLLQKKEMEGSRDNFFFAGIDKMRFRKPVVAGDTLFMKMTLVKERATIVKMAGEAFVEGNLVCQGEFLLAYGS